MKSKIFSTNNGKLNHCASQYNLRLVAFDLPAGHTCPAANICHSRANREGMVNGSAIQDFGSLRCYAASAEAQYKNTRDLRWRNFEASQSGDFVNMICDEIQRLGLTSIRIHSSGDFYSREYVNKWIQIARLNPQVTFWGYTKMLPFYNVLNAESNMFFVYSIGGLFDNRLTGKEITCTIVTDEIYPTFEAVITCEKENRSNDYEYIVIKRESFGIRLHGTQAKKNK